MGCIHVSLDCTCVCALFDGDIDGDGLRARHVLFLSLGVLDRSARCDCRHGLCVSVLFAASTASCIGDFCDLDDGCVAGLCGAVAMDSNMD